MHIRDTDQDENFQINLTSLIDVVFLLLIFFMVATSFLDPEKEISIELPQAQSGQSLEQTPDEIIINVLRDGSLLVGGNQVDRTGLESTLRRAARANPETPVTIRGDRLVAHEQVVRVMDACGLAGLSNLAVGTLESRATVGGRETRGE